MTTIKQRIERILELRRECEKAWNEAHGSFEDYAVPRMKLDGEIIEACDLLAELLPMVDDARRYRWLTEDHASLETRRAVQSIGEGIVSRSYASTSQSIDAQMNKENPNV